MLTLKTIHLKNFQSHRDTTIDLVPGMNALVGPSDSGKTAVIRGIRWAMYNEPRGDAFVRHGTDHCQVRLVFSDGFTLVRGREKTKNYYEIIDVQGKTHHYEGFGSQLPEEIEKHLGIRRIPMASDTWEELNISRQLDPAFLLHETDRVKAEAIGRLSGAYLVDQVLGDLAKEKNQVRRQLAFEKEEKARAEEEIQAYAYLAEEKQALDHLRKTIARIEDQQVLVARLQQIQAQVAGLGQQEEILRGQIHRAQAIEDLAPRVEKLAKLAQSHQDLVHKQVLAQNLARGLAHCQAIIQATDQLDQLEAKLQALGQRVGKVQALRSLAHRWKKNQVDFQRTQALIQARATDQVEASYTQLLDQVARHASLRQAANRHRLLAQERADLAGRVNFYQALPGLEGKLSQVAKLEEKRRALVRSQETLAKNQLARTREEERIGALTRQRELYLATYGDLLAQRGLCPTCHQALDPDHLKNLIDEMRKEIDQ